MMNSDSTHEKVCIYYRHQHAEYLGKYYLMHSHAGYKFSFISDFDFLKTLHISIPEKFSSLRGAQIALPSPNYNLSAYGQPLSGNNIPEISRCRSLNSLSVILGEKIYNDLCRSVGEYLDSGKFSIAFGMHIDDSISHIFSSECFRRNIPYFSFSPSFVPGRTEVLEGPWSRLSTLKISPVTESDIDKLIMSFKQRVHSYHWGWKPSYSRVRYFKDLIRSAIRNRIFTLQYFMSSKTLYTSLASIHSAKPSLAYMFNDLYGGHNTTISQLPKSKFKKCCYLPLPFLPEGSTDYWVSNISSLLFYPYLLHCIDNNPDILFVVKPHPAMHGITPVSVISKLRRKNNVFLLHPVVGSCSIFPHVDFVYVGRGSTVLEAFYNDIPIITYSANSHIDIFLDIFPHHDFSNPRSLALAFAKRYSSNEPHFSESDKQHVAYRLLSSSSIHRVGSYELYTAFLDSLSSH